MKVFVYPSGWSADGEGVVFNFYAFGKVGAGGGYTVEPTGCKTPHEYQDRIVTATLVELDRTVAGHSVQRHEICVPSFTRG